MLLESPTEMPTECAPVEGFPPATLGGFRETAKIAGRLTFSLAVAVPLSVAVMFGVAAEATAVVITVKLAVVEPAGTFTEAGKQAAALLVESPTEPPPEGAVPVNVTVSAEEVPPVTLVTTND